MSSESIDPAALAISLIALVATLWIAIGGWRRDARLRHEDQKGTVVDRLVSMIESEAAAATDPTWTIARLHEGRAHHIRAVAIMSSVAKPRRDDALVLMVATNAYKLGKEARRYLSSGEAQAELETGEYGKRRAAITDTSVAMCEDLLDWQQGKAKAGSLRSFYDHYTEKCTKAGITVPPEPTL
ncbi:hypothetical protein MUN78_10300 [Leucobacter allii]|uniref:Uncharacterized protein n=1 Tax=Leucobacter allii TaxID=2932247 RepID=A0ABY4FHE3_9MICO|nr:hypothetical protein [Leucobacter allii]UOQ56094.1 hypothetical protein MUN78_10300 [Leucobacter allii]